MHAYGIFSAWKKESKIHWEYVFKKIQKGKRIKKPKNNLKQNPRYMIESVSGIILNCFGRKKIQYQTIFRRWL